MATLNVLGLNCGTSVDGVDVALVRISALAGADVALSLRHYSEHAVPAPLRARILALCRPGAPTTLAEVCDLNFELGDVFAAAALESGVDLAHVDLVASHGQTLWHHPLATGADGWAGGERRAATLQMGESAVLAARTGVTVASDFRVAEVAAGRQGAPLSGILESALLRRDGDGPDGSAGLVVCQNIGGMANASVVGPSGWFAYDTGPGNVLIDCAVRAVSGGAAECDVGGRRALAGAAGIDTAYVDAWLGACAYLRQRPPKTTGRELFSEAMGLRIVAELRARGRTDDEVVATVTRLTAASICGSLRTHVEAAHGPIAELLVSGGGARNPVLMRELARAFPHARVRTLDDATASALPADAKEAVLFALLGYLCVAGRPAPRSALDGGADAVLGKITPGLNLATLMRRALSDERGPLGRVVLQ